MKRKQDPWEARVEGEDWDVLEGIFLSGPEAMDLDRQNCLFRLALLSEVRRFREISELDSSHGLAADLSATLVKDALG